MKIRAILLCSDDRAAIFDTGRYATRSAQMRLPLKPLGTMFIALM